MARYRIAKTRLAELLALDDRAADDGFAVLERLGLDPVAAVGPLLSLLGRASPLCWRAAVVLGHTLATLAGSDLPKARECLRRLMWHMNEDSGNISWGICESMGEALARSPFLAAEYGRILLSYGRQTGRADNYIDHGPLRRGVYWGIARFAASPSADADCTSLAWGVLTEGLHDDDSRASGVAAWGIAQLARSGPLPDAAARGPLLAALELLAQQPCGDSCELWDAGALRAEPVDYWRGQALAAVAGA